MGLFGFGKKKKEEKQASACCCVSAPQVEEHTNTCCGEPVDGICCVKVRRAAPPAMSSWSTPRKR